ncbi:holo-[acyl-carrier-protein] synthase [Helicobacter didelphidarum]|uniref:Holo-[acyl-carrier-protein] synthase n=1 Tax=Helicobacter didelphidarum TaxID=2040648 RepID=A0A3D8IED3_9HELI|nr:holo-ACP synthase [Helicobacter didelphidarum]RDU63583.1 holo-[acyl-carrier-protein] synthase [Helicobacter didelphidarum]
MNFEIGTDIVSIARIEKAVEKHGLNFLQRFLLPSEILLACKNTDYLLNLFLESKSEQENKQDIKKNQKIIQLNNIICLPTHKAINTENLLFSEKDKQRYSKCSDMLFSFLHTNFDKMYFMLPTLAGFWSIKESCSKALGVGIGESLSFHDMCIFKDSKGKPHLALHERMLKTWNLKKASISITHDNGMAFSVCVIIF